MYGINPYAQAGWYNPANPSSINERQGPAMSSQPPTFGALPYPDAPSPSTKRLVFTSQGAGLIQSCDVVDADTRLTYYKIKMEGRGYDYTSVQRPNGTQVGYIVWKPQGPEIELFGVIGTQNARDWLPLSPDQSSRFMQFHGKHYTWQFARDAMYFYGYTLNRHQQLGKVYPAKDGTTVFEASELVFNNGMLESVILAITLILSERFRG
ncbi:hypothetical protein P691DRAFT_709221 [Macrolepiota fuliginosa MF-IS2]|uniref:DUF6593 domain-containing protein n=1 Tax=Macrolepiota fuliginosa MF-IS2 TaxID=1400762 RepID=A0A9P5X7L8_9AGAR|nr:hypothetical protein P691DRAFT_709221 [Macrolepiota fuliginosa MF-IS2]